VELKGVKRSKKEIEDMCFESLELLSFNFFYLLLTSSISLFFLLF